MFVNYERCSPPMTALDSPPAAAPTTAGAAPATSVAAPSIRADLGSTLSALQWIAGGYALTFAVGLVTGGRLGDIFGRRRLFLAGVAGFAVASLLCGIAPSTEALIGFRLLQGACAAIMIPQGFG